MTPTPKKHASFSTPKFEPQKKTTFDIKKDFSNIRELNKALLKAQKTQTFKEFASKYDIPYNDISEIRQNAKSKFRS